MILRCDNLGGSVNATQTASLGSIWSEKMLHPPRSILSAPFGGSTILSSSIGYISLLSGARMEPLNPGHPYCAASVNFTFSVYFVLSTCITTASFFVKGFFLCTKRYPSSNPRALQSNSVFSHFAIVGDIAANKRSSSIKGNRTTHNHGIALPFGSTGTSIG